MDTEGLLRLLKENKVNFIVIGASAFPAYGYARATLDIDIFIEPNLKNAKKTMNALEQFGYNLIDLTPTDFIESKILIRQYSVEADFHPFVKGVDFKEIWKNKIKSKFGNTEVFFPSIEDMIKMKRAAGRGIQQGAYASDSATAERTDKKDILSFLPGRCGTFTQVLG
jgi:predicted nucleotidyltransferase